MKGENPFLEKKKERLVLLKKMLDSLTKDGEKVKIGRMISVIEINFGLSKKTAREYLDTFVASEFIEKEGGFVKRKNGTSHTHSHSL